MVSGVERRAARTLWIGAAVALCLVANGCAEGSTFPVGVGTGAGATTGSGQGGAGAGTSGSSSSGAAGGGTGAGSTGGSTGTSAGSTSASSGASSSGTTAGAEGAACSSSSQCDSGLACAPAYDNGAEQCEKTCTMSTSCTSPGGACVNLATGKPGTVCTASCDPTTNGGCLPTEACRVFTANANAKHLSTYCGGIGAGSQGQTCKANSDCKAGFECVSGLFSSDCEQLCDPKGGACPGGRTCTSLGLSLGTNQVGTCE